MAIVNPDARDAWWGSYDELRLRARAIVPTELADGSLIYHWHSAPLDAESDVEAPLVSEATPSARTRLAVRLALLCARVAPRRSAARLRRFALDLLTLEPGPGAVATWPDRWVSAALPSALATAGLAPPPDA